jgi:radical SAM protein (TIGR01212 family)
MTLEDQIIRGFERLRRRYGTDRAILYFQSYSTTNLPVCDLVKVIERAIAFSENLGCVVGLGLGARPDQVPDELLRFLEKLAERHTEIWLELGVQTTDDSGLEWLNRGHGIVEVEDALERSRHCRGLSVCAHLIAGIPGEKDDQLACSAEWLSARGIHGIKFHPLYVLSGTPLERLFRQGLFVPLTRSGYTKKVVGALRSLRPEVAIQRLSADASFPRLVAPEWVLDKQAVMKDIEGLLVQLDARQGDHWTK